MFPRTDAVFFLRRGTAKLCIAIAAIGFAGAASADDRPAGAYVCTVEQKAGIAEEHLEGAPRPKAFIEKTAAQFRIVVTRATRNTKARVEEPKRAILHDTYRGSDGWHFASSSGQSFLRLSSASSESGWLFFYHAGFEQPSVDNENLSVRSGVCAPVK